MATDVTTSDRVGPKSGLWAASFRVMFPLASLWAVVCVGLWQWGHTVWPNLNLSVAWHIHEMTFGFGGAAVAGYLLTACSSWTGRAPVHGWPMMVLVAFWCMTRFGVLAGHAMPVWLSILPAVAYFWWIAFLLTIEAWRCGKGWRPSYIVFCVLAGVGSGVWINAMHANAEILPAVPVLGFVFLLTLVGARMVPAFLQSAADREGRSYPCIPSYEHVLNLALLASGFLAMALDYRKASGVLFLAVSANFLRHVGVWPLRSVLKNSLLAMLLLGFLWLPIGLLMWARILMLVEFSATEAAHALMMGAMGGLILAVSARAFARRSDDGLKARAGTFLAFLLVMISVPLRLADRLDLAAAMWCAGWLLYFFLILPQIFGPVPRPVFSGARNT